MSRYLVTGGGGFIGSHISRALVRRGAEVRVLDDFCTGRRSNLFDLEDRIEVITGSVCEGELAREALAGVDCCFHLAAVPSVSRSLENPVRSNRVNVEGTLQVLLQCREAGVRRVICASSSSVYGNQMRGRAAREDFPRAPISPYAVSKAAAEMHGEVFASLYGMDVVFLRYFNVFGPYQNPDSAYAAVIPLFIKQMMRGERPLVHGDGSQARDFSYIENVVSANLLACDAAGTIAGVYNIACGETSSIMTLVSCLNDLLGTGHEAEHGPGRPGDIRSSWADVSKAEKAFGYRPLVRLREGLARTVEWYLASQKAA